MQEQTVAAYLLVLVLVIAARWRERRFRYLLIAEPRLRRIKE
jgi:hypothetical protein